MPNETPGNPHAPGTSVNPGAPQQTPPGQARPPAPPTQRPAMPRPGSIEPEPVPVADPSGPVTTSRKITAFGKEQKHEEQWTRTPNTTGTGAIHVKTFHSKITDDALKYMDQTINEWLDTHPEYEVKFVTSTVGVLSGKLKEPALICQVWV